jgi:hypothetical protein
MMTNETTKRALGLALGLGGALLGLGVAAVATVRSAREQQEAVLDDDHALAPEYVLSDHESEVYRIGFHELWSIWRDTVPQEQVSTAETFEFWDRIRFTFVNLADELSKPFLKSYKYISVDGSSIEITSVIGQLERAVFSDRPEELSDDDAVASIKNILLLLIVLQAGGFTFFDDFHDFIDWFRNPDRYHAVLRRNADDDALLS